MKRVQITLDEKKLKKVEETLSYSGLTFSQACNMLASAIIAEGGLPFTPPKKFTKNDFDEVITKTLQKVVVEVNGEGEVFEYPLGDWFEKAGMEVAFLDESQLADTDFNNAGIYIVDQTFDSVIPVDNYNLASSLLAILRDTPDCQFYFKDDLQAQLMPTVKMDAELHNAVQQALVKYGVAKNHFRLKDELTEVDKVDIETLSELSDIVDKLNNNIPVDIMLLRAFVEDMEKIEVD